MTPAQETKTYLLNANLPADIYPHVASALYRDNPKLGAIETVTQGADRAPLALAMLFDLPKEQRPGQLQTGINHVTSRMQSLRACGAWKRVRAVSFVLCTPTPARGPAAALSAALIRAGTEAVSKRATLQTLLLEYTIDPVSGRLQSYTTHQQNDATLMVDYLGQCLNEAERAGAMLPPD